MPGTEGWVYICTAHKTNGEPCRLPAMRGSKVCNKHGGMAGQVRAAARARIDALVDPAISTLRREMLRGDSSSVRLKAAESVLDRAGIVAERAEATATDVNITVSYADVEMAKAVVAKTIDVEYRAELPDGQNGNGASNGHDA